MTKFYFEYNATSQLRPRSGAAHILRPDPSLLSNPSNTSFSPRLELSQADSSYVNPHNNANLFGVCHKLRGISFLNVGSCLSLVSDFVLSDCCGKSVMSEISVRLVLSIRISSFTECDNSHIHHHCDISETCPSSRCQAFFQNYQIRWELHWKQRGIGIISQQWSGRARLCSLAGFSTFSEQQWRFQLRTATARVCKLRNFLIA